MKTAAIIVSAITILLLLSTLLCGLWIKSKGLTDQSSLAFHTQLGVASVVGGLASAILLLVYALKK